MDGNNGFVTDHSVQGYAEKLGMLLEHPELLRRAGSGARSTLCTSWRDVVQEVKERYLSLLGRNILRYRGGGITIPVLN